MKREVRSMCLIDYFVIIGHWSVGWQRPVPLLPPPHSFYHLSTNHIVFLLLYVPQFRVVDPHKHNFRLVLYKNTISHIETADHHVPTVPRESVHEKEFLDTIHDPCLPEVQSETNVDDMNDQWCRNNLQHYHVLDLYGQCQDRLNDWERNYSETNW